MQKMTKEFPDGPLSREDEEENPHRFRRESLELLRRSTAELGWRYKLWIPASVLLASVFLLPPRLLQYFTEGATDIGNVDGGELVRNLIWFGILIGICLWIGIFFGGVLAEWLRLQISVSLRSRALESMLDAKLEKIDEAERGDWMTRMTGDLASCEDFLSDSLPMQIRDITILLGSALLFAISSGWIAILPIVAAILLAWINVVAQKKMAPTLGASRQVQGEIFQTIIESFEGLRTIRSFGGESSVKRLLDKQLTHLKSIGMRIIKIMSALMGVNEMASQLVITLILALVAYRLAGDSLTVNEALVYPFYINLFLNSAKGLVASAYDWNRFFIEGGRLATILYDETGKLDDDAPLEGVVGISGISGKGIEVGYGNDPPVIEGFDFEVNRGELVVLSGPSGCGKSTVLEVMAGLRSHSAGELFLSTKHSDPENVPSIPRSICAFVEQQPYLFVGTIRDNIKLGQSRLFDVEIKSVVKAMGLDEVIENRGGLDAVLKDRGRNWSVGQQYRMALCRAMISKRPFLMLDEPFAALDEDSIDQVIDAIELARKAGAGVVVVTHVLPGNLRADRIVKMMPTTD